MVIVYCDKCGRRVPDNEIAEGRAVQRSKESWLCAACALPAPKPAAQRTTTATPIGAIAKRRSSAALPPKAASPEAVPKTKTGPNLVVWLLGAGGVCLVAAGVTLLCSGPDQSSNRRAAEPAAAPVPPGQAPPREPTAKGSVASGAASSAKPVSPTPGASVSEPGNKAGTRTAVANEPKAAPPTDDYDPRAAVAASILAEAKAQFATNPDEQLEYKAKLERVRDGYARTPAAIEAEKLLAETKNLPSVLDALDGIPEAKAYKLVYDLDLAKLGHSVNYTVDRRAEIAQPFDRIAYFVELKPQGRGKQWVFVSLDAFTDDLGKIGVPTLSSGAFFQQNVTNMDVSSNVNGIVTGTALAGGNIEFWPNNYGPRNSANVPGASSDRYDFGDEPAGRTPGDGYGSMQVHNHEAKQSVFVINHWREGGNADLGIGNRPVDNPDWTFSGSSRDYRGKRLRVLVHLK